MKSNKIENRNSSAEGTKIKKNARWKLQIPIEKIKIQRWSNYKLEEYAHYVVLMESHELKNKHNTYT